MQSHLLLEARGVSVCSCRKMHLLGEKEGCTLRGVVLVTGRTGQPSLQRDRGGLCGALRNACEALWTDLTGSSITAPTKGMKKQEHTRQLSTTKCHMGSYSSHCLKKARDYPETWSKGAKLRGGRES